VVTHDAAQAAWADRVVRLRDGRIDSITGDSPVSEPATTQAPDTLTAELQR
jgi:ABC-type sulfate/molybdate transport systems ATPase subunit